MGNEPFQMVTDNYRRPLSGKEKAAQALFGNCMRELRGTGDPAAIKALLEEELQKRKG